MFAILPRFDYVFDDAEIYDDLTEAKLNALDWSVELAGMEVIISKRKGSRWTPVVSIQA